MANRWIDPEQAQYPTSGETIATCEHTEAEKWRYHRSRRQVLVRCADGLLIFTRYIVVCQACVRKASGNMRAYKLYAAKYTGLRFAN